MTAASFASCQVMVTESGRVCILADNGIYHRWGDGWCHRNRNRLSTPQMVTVAETVLALETREQQHKDGR